MRALHLECRAAECVPHVLHRLEQLATLLALAETGLNELVLLGVGQRCGVFLDCALLLVDR